MKSPVLALLFSCLLASFGLARADMVQLKGVTITGTLTVESSVQGQAPTVVALSTKSLLGLFGQGGIKPANATYFEDLSTGSVELTDLTGSTLYGVVFTFESAGHASIHGQDVKSQLYTSSQLLAGALSGVTLSKSKTVPTGLKSTITLIGGGQFNSQPAILRATFTALFPI